MQVALPHLIKASKASMATATNVPAMAAEVSQTQISTAREMFQTLECTLQL